MMNEDDFKDPARIPPSVRRIPSWLTLLLLPIASRYL